MFTMTTLSSLNRFAQHNNYNINFTKSKNAKIYSIFRMTCTFPISDTLIYLHDPKLSQRCEPPVPCVMQLTTGIHTHPY